MSKDLPVIARNIKKYRDKLGISQDKLSKLAGVTLHTLTKIETCFLGKSANVSSFIPNSSNSLWE